MVGYGKSKRNTYVKECRTLDVNKLELEPGRGTIYWARERDDDPEATVSYQYDGNSLRLQYTVTNTVLYGEEKKESYDYRIPIVKTDCNFGGERAWFCCPVNDCGARVGKLYLPPRGEVFACRNCHDLSYESQGKSNSPQYELIDRWKRKAEKILEELEVDTSSGGSFSLPSPSGLKRPKGMHEDTYQELVREYSRCRERVDVGFVRRVQEITGEDFGA
ncbi:hypothetical protein KGY79_12395 [Candidatus Bipolaricaulota bacterium]|nr:hypothetical protein [Candidatus Bipolaricaulota bacterium]